MAIPFTDLTIVEQQKENIQPLNDGRSVSKLAENFKNATNSMTHYKQDQTRERDAYENQLKIIAELDDPLQVFLDYINWTHDNFPQGSSSQSGLLTILERCTSCFRDVSYYKNDPRYLKVWLEYTNYSDAPRDIFVYLAKKQIGNELALYYEEFSRYLELSGKMEDAKQIYELGIQSEARPLLRLERNYRNFLERQATGLTSASEAQRAGLALKRGDAIFPTAEDSHISNPRKKSKMQIFNDDSNEVGILQSIFNESSTDSNELGTIRSRIKENVISARPWIGEQIRQKGVIEKKLKIAVYKDGQEIDKRDVKSKDFVEDSNGSVATVISQPGKTREKVLINMELIYPNNDDEYSLDEILGLTRQVSALNFKNKDVNMTESNSNEHESYIEKNHTLTIPLKDDNDDETFHGDRQVPNSPTVTMVSKMSANEVIGMFNNAAQGLTTDDEEEKTDTEHTGNYDGFVTETIYPINDGHVSENANKSPQISSPNETAAQGYFSSPFVEEPQPRELEQKLFNPLDPILRQNLLSNLSIPIEAYVGYLDFGNININKLDGINELTNKHTRIIAKGKPGSIINYLGDESFCLRYELGRGGFGVVVLIETETGSLKALKIESPSSKWEFYILKQIHRRLQGELSLMFVKPEALYYFSDESYMIIDYCNQGTILDIVNHYSNKGSNVDEVLCVFLTVELCKAVEGLHGIGIIHGDLKADNCMLRFESIKSQWSENYSRLGDFNWSAKGITLIDFGRAIDVTLFEDNVKFISDWETDEQDCPQMNKNEPWKYEADYYGLASVIHTMLFGRYIEICELEDGTTKLKASFKRYWQLDLWNDLFNLLLNPYSDSSYTSQAPIIDQLKLQRQRFESWLETNAGAKRLKSIIADLEYELSELEKVLLRG
ncbi:uncharacterized protein PRCAT00000378001 [Priceomyces carsonii]|uniref:uncharacterized protein n=1 Tax=Priceomyces carsonii TaxID=28549 RepID=UPI002EDA3AEC|nr:unnamed protein product [Priceomyces carsonii]